MQAAQSIFMGRGIKVASTPGRKNHYYFPGLIKVDHLLPGRRKIAAKRAYREGSLKLAILRAGENHGILC